VGEAAAITRRVCPFPASQFQGPGNSGPRRLPRRSEAAKLREVRLIILRVTSLLRSFAVIFWGCGHAALGALGVLRGEKSGLARFGIQIPDLLIFLCRETGAIFTVLRLKCHSRFPKCPATRGGYPSESRTGESRPEIGTEFAHFATLNNNLTCGELQGKNVGGVRLLVSHVLPWLVTWSL